MLPRTAEARAAFVKAAASSIVATALDVVCLIALVEAGNVYVTLAAFLAATAGGIANFLVNKFWAFRDPSPIGLRQVVTYILVSLANALWVAAIVELLAVQMHLPYLAAKAVAAVVVFVLWSYPAQARLVFKKTSRRRSDP